MPDSPRIVRRNGWSLGWLAVAFGVVIIASHIESGGARWAAPAWQFALHVPGAPATWGALILLAGVAILYGSRRHDVRWRVRGAWVAFWWFCALSAAAGISFSSDLADGGLNLVNPLAVLTWGCFAGMYRLHIRDERDARDA